MQFQVLKRTLFNNLPLTKQHSQYGIIRDKRLIQFDNFDGSSKFTGKKLGWCCVQWIYLTNKTTIKNVVFFSSVKKSIAFKIALAIFPICSTSESILNGLAICWLRKKTTEWMIVIHWKGYSSFIFCFSFLFLFHSHFDPNVMRCFFLCWKKKL